MPWSFPLRYNLVDDRKRILSRMFQPFTVHLLFSPPTNSKKLGSIYWTSNRASPDISPVYSIPVQMLHNHILLMHVVYYMVHVPLTLFSIFVETYIYIYKKPNKSKCSLQQTSHLHTKKKKLTVSINKTKSMRSQ